MLIDFLIVSETLELKRLLCLGSTKMFSSTWNSQVILTKVAKSEAFSQIT